MEGWVVFLELLYFLPLARTLDRIRDFGNGEIKTIGES